MARSCEMRILRKWILIEAKKNKNKMEKKEAEKQ